MRSVGVWDPVPTDDTARSTWRAAASGLEPNVSGAHSHPDQVARVLGARVARTGDPLCGCAVESVSPKHHTFDLVHV